MKRYCIAKIVGKGTEFDPFRSSIQNHSDVHYEFGEIVVDPNTGQPTHSFVLAIVETASLSRLMKDDDIDVLPDFPLDGKMSAMQGNTKSAMTATLAKYGVSIRGSDGFRDAIRAVGRVIKPDFDENDFDLSD